MKSKCSSILKASVALILTVLMLFGSVSSVVAAVVERAELAGEAALAGSGASADLASTGLTGGGYIYVSTQYAQWSGGGSAANWGDGVTFVAVFRDSNDTYSTESTHQAGTWVKNINGSNASGGQIYRFSVPSGTWSYMRLYRASAVGWNNKYNETGKIALVANTSTNNMLTYFKEGADGTTSNWEDKYQYDSTASLSASKTSATTGENVTLTPSISSNTTYNEYKSVSYSISPSSGASITGNTFTATSAGTFTVTATVTYNAKGFTGITKTATATKTITVTQAATTYTSIAVAAKGSTDGSTFNTTLSGTPATISANSYTTGSSALNISAGTVSGYTFYKWVVTAGSGTIGSATSASTTFTPSASNTTVTAQYKKSYSVTKNSPTGGSITLNKTTVLAGDTFKVTLAPSSGYRVATFTVGDVDKKSSLNSSNEYTHTATGTGSSFAVNATFEAIPATTIYVKKTLASTFSNIHIWSNTSDNWTGAWPGQALSGWSSTTDGKYYYKSFNQDYSTFKFILNNNSSPQTSDSDAYATGKTYYIDSATASQKAVLTEGIPQASTITYPTGNFTIGGTKPTSAYTGETVSFTVTAADGYRIDKVQYTPTGGTATTITASSGTYSFTMPDKNVTVSVTAVKTYTVTLSAAGTGMGTTRQYFVGTTPGTYSNYSSAITVDAGSTVYFKVSYATGYEYNTVTNATVYTANTVFKTAAINADTTVTITAKKISYAVSVDAKYSTNGTTFATDFPSGSKPAVTIAATSATQLDGVAVTAPATDPEGYVFAGWYTANGSFANSANKDTTFKPNAANAVAIARYKKLHTVTISVDNTGTGAGTVTVSKTSVEAGGSYTITATAKSGSAIESVKVNGTAKTATASQTVSSVSANQTVVVKFKSNVYLKGTMNSWSGDVMTANSAGTSYTIANVVLNAGTTYEFKHFVDSGSGVWSNTAPATWALNGIATHGTKDDGNGSTNLTITPSVKAKVTFVSDGTKFTSITAIPYDSTTYNVTLTQSADYTITSTYMGVEYTTSGKNANVTVPVYSGTGFSYTVTPASGKYLSAVAQSNSVALSPAFSATTHANSYTGTVSSVSKAFAVSATAASKLSVAAKTNKSARGTVSINKSTAAPGESITITVSPKNGVLNTLTATYANGAVYTCNLTTKAWTKTTNATSSAPASTAANKLDLAAVGANIALVASGADTTYPMTLAESSAVTINAVFDNYSAESTWYYNGYDTSGNALSGYHGKQMTEGMVSGEKFSYYHVEGRTGTDQLMTVSNGRVADTRYVYFTRPKNFGYWNQSNSPKAHFWKNGGSEYDTWPGNTMTWVYDNDMGEAVFKIAIPVGADRVSFNDASNNNQQQTVDIDLTNTSGAYYVSQWNSSANKYDYGTWSTGYSDQGYVVSGTEYFYQNSTYNGDYTGDFNTIGFYNHNTASKYFAKPKDLKTNTGDYYINVLYPNTTYTINGVTKKTGTNPMIIWSAEPLAGDDENVTVYAKDGSIRSESYGSTYANIADTKIYLNNATVGTKHSGNITNQTWETYKAAKGDTLVIKTQIGATDSSTLSNAADLKAKYYVRGFCVNGEVSELLSWNADGLYTLTYKIPEDTEITKFEITPIYYLKDTTANPIVTYRVTGFTDELKQVGSGKPNWGDTLYTYPFYGKLGSNNNALGAYPGQPMVYYKGQYQMQIPQKSTAWDIYYDDGALSGYSGNTEKANAVANTNVSGVTMSNGYYDIVHRQIMGYGDNSASADHVQTYDYGDFFKIFNEKKPVDNIVFDFKYETTTHNFETNAPASPTPANLTSTYKNGFELLTNFHGKHVDLFGTPLSGTAADPEQTTPVYVVSIGGVNGSGGVENIAGYYATEWKVFTSSASSPSSSNSYSLMSAGGKNSIPPEVLVLNDDDTTSFNETTYPSADANHNITDWKALYTALEAYRGKPVMITYEAADAQIGAGNYATSGSGGATRNDGRWLYSKTGENITSTIRIDVSHDTGETYVENPASGEAGHVDGLSAYFTNADAYQKMTYATTIDPDKTFDFEAKTTNASYKFVGWYMEDGTKITSDNVSHTERSGSYTFVARFMEISSGQLTLSHSVDTGVEVEVDGHYYTCDGSGTAKIGAVVTDAETNEVLRTFDLSSSDITIPERFIGNDKNYNITVTLEAIADTNTAYGTSKLANTDASSVTESRFFNPKTPTTSGKTTTYTFTFNVKNDLYNGTNQRALALTYHSYFIQYKFNYQINYTFNDRNNKTKQYKRIGTLTPGEANTYVKKVGSNRYLDKSFIEKMAPHESNFGQNITWNFEDYLISTGGEDGSNYEYGINAHYTAVQSDFNKRNITFVLPYQHNNGVAVMTDGVGTKATTKNLEFIEVKDNEGNVTADNRVDFNTIPVLPNGGENGIFTENGKKNWIAAPATITDGSSTYNFQYWSVKPTDRAGENDPDVARCYFQGFNFVAYDNYTITPVYGESTVEPSDFGKNTNITYVETTRNQWNSNGTDYAKTQTSYAADLLYNDFIIAYNYDGKDIYNGEANDDIAELGVVVERIKKLEIKDDGSYDTTLSRYTDIAPNVEGVDAAIASATDITLSGSRSISKHAIDPTSLDNKNRIQFYNGIYNSAGWVQNDEGGTPAQNYAYKNYVYRAYSYMKLNDGTVIKSAVPAYFTMYDVATADSGDM